MLTKMLRSIDNHYRCPTSDIRSISLILIYLFELHLLITTPNVFFLWNFEKKLLHPLQEFTWLFLKYNKILIVIKWKYFIILHAEHIHFDMHLICNRFPNGTKQSLTPLVQENEDCSQPRKQVSKGFSMESRDERQWITHYISVSSHPLLSKTHRGSSTFVALEKVINNVGYSSGTRELLPPPSSFSLWISWRKKFKCILIHANLTTSYFSNLVPLGIANYSQTNWWLFPPLPPGISSFLSLMWPQSSSNFRSYLSLMILPIACFF